MKYDTIELNAELGTQPGYSAMLFSYGIKINGVEFHPEHSLDLTDSVYLSPLHCRLKEVPLNGVR
jgi:predicted O-methyltransferase YrrM